MTGKVGVLALQGDVPEHAAFAARLVGADRVVHVRTPDQLSQVGALLMPGGESTTFSRLVDDARLREPLTARIRAGLPVLATCAGLILLAREVEPSRHGRDPTPLGVLDVKVRRNDYGRQVDSFEAKLSVEGIGEDIPAAFIRAPKILSCGPDVRTLASWAGDPVLVRAGKLWGLTFHPEVTDDPRVHAAFLRDAGLLDA